MHEHSVAVEELQKQVSSRTGILSFTSKGVSNTLRSRGHKGIDLSKLNHILEIGPDYVTLEPRVTFHQLCLATLKEGLLPPVVPEFTSITVGGAIMGAALESSSHKFGQVSDTCLEYEVLLGNGEIIRATPEENSDLFFGLSGSYGTLGLLTKIKLRLIRAKNYVHITYKRMKTKELLSFLQATHRADFVEGIVFKKEAGTAIIGNFANQIKGSLFRQNRYWSPWYIQHVSEFQGSEEYMPIKEYLFRLDRGAFWMGRYLLSIPTILQTLFRIGTPKLAHNMLYPNLMFRLLFGWTFSSKHLYQLLHTVPKEISKELFFVHDFYTPYSKVFEICESFMEQTEIFPIWLCPVKRSDQPQILAPHYGHEHFLNIGLYGIPRSSLTIPELTAKLEKELADAGGRKMLYSHSYYDRAQFAKIYDDAAYTALRQKFFAEKSFAHIYNKVVM